MNTIPNHMRKSHALTIGTMPTNVTFYVTPWTLDADVYGHLFIDSGVEPLPKDGGTVSIGIRRADDGQIHAYIPKHNTYKWDDSGVVSATKVLIDVIHVI